MKKRQYRLPYASNQIDRRAEESAHFNLPESVVKSAMGVTQFREKYGRRINHCAYPGC